MRGKGLILGLALSVMLSMQSFAATEIGLNLNWKYASNAKINTGKAILFTSDSKNPKKITIAVNAGHGTKGGEKLRTLCHPDGTRKVTGGTNAAGSTTAMAVKATMFYLFVMERMCSWTMWQEPCWQTIRRMRTSLCTGIPRKRIREPSLCRFRMH